MIDETKTQELLASVEGRDMTDDEMALFTHAQELANGVLSFLAIMRVSTNSALVIMSHTAALLMASAIEGADGSMCEVELRTNGAVLIGDDERLGVHVATVRNLLEAARKNRAEMNATKETPAKQRMN